MEDRELCELLLIAISRRSMLKDLSIPLADRNSFFARAADGMEERVFRYKKTITVRTFGHHNEADG